MDLLVLEHLLFGCELNADAGGSWALGLQNFLCSCVLPGLQKVFKRSENPGGKQEIPVP